MGERTLRGSRLGAVSYETDRNTELEKISAAALHAVLVSTDVISVRPSPWVRRL